MNILIHTCTDKDKEAVSGPTLWNSLPLTLRDPSRGGATVLKVGDNFLTPHFLASGGQNNA